MKFSDLKYLSAFIIPVLVALGIIYGGVWCYAAFIFAFVMVPLLEPFLNSSPDNLDESERLSKSQSLFFDFLLYLNIPVIYGMFILINNQMVTSGYSVNELIGLTLSMGILLGSCGINVAHELGHKNHWFAKTGAILLLIPSFYTHFHIEHNRGHHKNVATPKDPATARYGESLYRFWIRSIKDSYKHAWELESKRMNALSLSKYSLSNHMIQFSILQLIYLFMISSFLSSGVVLILIGGGVISFLFLEIINYVEHYGLRRKLQESGRYEKVQPWHSWNSNHHLGRIILYELTRHSDHHYLANKKYQLLDHHMSSPQLPYGYPSSMLLALLPFLWFRIMNPKVKEFEFQLD